MTENSKLIGLSRRGFVTSLATFAGAGLTGTELLARGGGGGIENMFKPNIRYEEDEDGNVRGHVYTQDQFVQLPRKKHFEYAQMSNVFVQGFSRNMAPHLFNMGYADIRRTRGLVIRIRGLKNRGDRKNVLRAEYETVRNDLENFNGSKAKRQLKAVYLNGVQIWSRRPREGILRTNFNF